MVCTVVATWPFSLGPVTHCIEMLRDEKTSVSAAVVDAIRLVELDPDVHTVGSYSFPNSDGVLQLDAAIIEVSAGRHRCGSVMALEGFSGSIEAAFTVMTQSPHPILVGDGARKFVESHGLLPSQSPVPTMELPVAKSLNKPAGSHGNHDTVGLIAVRDGVITVGCSSSGKQGKHPGRVGDSPIFGSGLYAEGGVGAAVCTGDGDKMCSFPLAFSVVTLMRSGHTPQEACTQAIQYLLALPQGDAEIEIAVIACSVHGDVGAACSPKYLSEFTFAAGSAEHQAEVYFCQPRPE
ncbi:asparaginase, putative [Bodo saltans]|uniref:Asparaginase, putative n=1 Tax=Bodo saltans TaxID=75058 RepID=A0A0S4JPA8_BODSA|nr:asparaginase, putative [Bodo saltans]|eukprot:CUG92516.1 asparaginase, putative [Bodo saltans]